MAARFDQVRLAQMFSRVGWARGLCAVAVLLGGLLLRMIAVLIVPVTVAVDAAVEAIFERRDLPLWVMSALDGVTDALRAVSLGVVWLIGRADAVAARLLVAEVAR
ncbi:hypothetical protein [Allonocardiopsis opalescens]|uniref:Uncharacterized protein n=1 Tax=Allonocardiopsis opalescens TaxID=1144618 RepID=A0A2T0Q750_9ACTN|nr:hypothetical protein [Allonocardiopsis opalescens]PRX99657.1 hypothetical protein CLV72_103262 [Allonocardiopsis opalescens]